MKKKLNLEALKVQSFVTSFEDGKEKTVKGGYISYDTHCDGPKCPNGTPYCTMQDDVYCDRTGSYCR